jgi:hypothetical protein
MQHSLSENDFYPICLAHFIKLKTEVIFTMNWELLTSYTTLLKTTTKVNNIIFIDFHLHMFLYVPL